MLLPFVLLMEIVCTLLGGGEASMKLLKEGWRGLKGQLAWTHNFEGRKGGIRAGEK